MLRLTENLENFMKFLFIFPKSVEVSQGIGRFGTFDIETYVESENFYPYCVVVYFNSNYFTSFLGESYVTTLNRRKMIITDPISIVLFKLRDYMKREGVKSLTLYVHNLSSFDGFFLLRTCASHKIKLNILKRDSKIYYLRVSIGNYKIEFRCSLLLLQASLNNCAQSFNVPMVKMSFNHDWVTKERLFYTGEVPEGFFSKDSVFVFKDYSLNYCRNDCKMLYEILLVFDREVREFGVDLEARVYSIPGLAFRVFKNSYLTFNTLVNLSKHVNIDNFIRNAYYGGRTEVFRSYIGGGRGFYYDVKGMYAQAMKQTLPCGIPIRTSEFDENWLITDMHKGFYTVDVEAPKIDIPLLPYRNEEGKLLFPWGNWRATYYSEELLLAHSLGYKFKPIEAIIFQESKPFLKEYVEDFTSVKERGGVYRAIGKLFINSLYGRFGLNPKDELTIIIPKRMEEYYAHRFHINDRVEIDSNLLLTYSPKPVLDLYKLNNIFIHYKKDMRAYKRRYSYTESNVAVAAAITSLGRIHLYKDMLAVSKNGGKIAYCDTDSIFAEFEESPLGKKHGNVYWDPENPLTQFEEGVFLAPKMYSIKDRNPHVKGVKVNLTMHEIFLSALANKNPSMKFTSLTQFYRENYELKLRKIDKEYLLWENDKREWYQDKEGVWVTRTKEINIDLQPLHSYSLDVRHSIDTTVFANLNNSVVNCSYQILNNIVEILIDKGDIIISLPAHSNEFNLLYYAIMAKLHLPGIQPSFLKVMYKTHNGIYYTLAPFLYSPNLYFKHSLTSFIEYIKHLRDKSEDKYDIQIPGLLIFKIIFPESKRMEISKFEIVYPIPESIRDSMMLEDLQDQTLLREWHQMEINKLDNNLAQTKKLIGDRKVKNYGIIIELIELIKPVKIIDNLIASVEEQYNIKEALINSLVMARIKSQQPSLQSILLLFLKKFKVEVTNKDIFIIYARAALLLLRLLYSKNKIRLIKSGRYSPYIVEISNPVLIDEFYKDKIWFSKNEYNPEKSRLKSDIRNIEFIPVSLNHDYFAYIQEIIKGIEKGELNKELYGFSLDKKSFEGELLTLNEGLKHYKYICEELKKRDQDSFFYYWFHDYRGRIYPKLTNFSIQSSKILRPGFIHKRTPLNIYTKEEIFNDPHYRNYIIKLLEKHVGAVDFNGAIKKLSRFEIDKSKDHYEIMMRKFEVEKLMKGETVQIAPISLDGQCNVYQHISALTKDKFIGSLVNTIEDKTEYKDLYDWFKEKVIEDLEEQKDKDQKAAYFLELIKAGINIKKLVKQPIMTFPYGSTNYNVMSYVKEFFKGTKISWEFIKYIANNINTLRKKHLKNTTNLESFLKEIIKIATVISWKLPDGYIIEQKAFKSEDVKISTSIDKKEMTVILPYSTNKISMKHHIQAITPNLIHSLDAYHLRRIIKRCIELNIPIFTLHDCVIIDIIHIKAMKEIIREEFNIIYSNPEKILKSFYLSILRSNPEMEEDSNIDNKIKSLMGNAKIKASKNLFN